MDEMAISRFKATCLAVLEQVGKTGRPLRVTRFGKPVAEIVPPSLPKNSRRLGAMAGTGQILGDIISPATDPEDWDALGG